MPFNSSRYVAFIVVVFFATWWLAGPRRRSPRAWFLLLVSAFFYLCSSWQFLLLLAVFATVTYFAGQRIAASEGPRKKLWCGFSVVLSLSALAFYKYLDFFGQSIGSALGAAGLDAHVPLFKLAMPLGISFFTFSAVSYAVDIYRGKLLPARSLRDYALYLSFFPKIASGPIARAGQFLPQLEADPAYDHDQVFRGLFEILLGLFKKLIIADLLSSTFVSLIYKNPGAATLPQAWIAMWAYSIQIFCDFSGYTDMAIGSARLLGFALPENFDRPYLSPNPQEFWRRWHITLSNWLRDYLYIALGGSRHGRARTYLALFLTMLLGGLWHGAAWTFVFWGAYHGGLLVVHRWWLEGKPKAQGEASALWRWGSIFFTFNLVALGWIFFRAPDIETAVGLISRLFVGDLSLAGIPKQTLLLLAAGVFVHNSVKVRQKAADLFIHLHPALQGACFLILVAIFDLFHSVSEPFIYFKF